MGFLGETGTKTKYIVLILNHNISRSSHRKAGASEQTLFRWLQNCGESGNHAATVDNVSTAKAEGLSRAASYSRGEEASQGGQTGGKALQGERK